MSTTSSYWCMFGLILYTFVLVLVSAQTQEPYDKLADHWFSKCFNETKDTKNKAFDKLYVDGVEFRRYLKYAFKFIPKEKKVFCDAERKELINRMKELSTDLRPCLSANEKYMEDFLLTSFTEFLHFLCHNDGEHINAFFHQNSAECRSKLLNNDNPNLPNCFSKLLKPSSGQPSKKELCTDITTVKQCFAEVLARECPSFGSYKKLNEEFFKYVSKPCSGCTFYSNIFLLIISLLASYLYRH